MTQGPGPAQQWMPQQQQAPAPQPPPAPAPPMQQEPTPQAPPTQQPPAPAQQQPQAGLMSNLQKAVLSAPPKKPLVEEDIHDKEKYIPVGINGILASTEKLLAVNRGLADVDARDSIAYKRVYSPARLLAESIRLDQGSIRRNIMRMASKTRSLKGLAPFAFDDYVGGLMTGNPLTTPIEEINPLQIVDTRRKLTLMGPGGVGSDDAISSGMQAVRADQFGFVSPVEGPESHRAGVDSRIAYGVKLGSDGNLYQRMLNRRTGRYEWVSPYSLLGKSVKLPE